jgi:glycosyltransferase involved in cell wall biosynthesis
MSSILYFMIRHEGSPEVYGGEKSTITTARLAQGLGHDAYFIITGADAIEGELRAAGFPFEVLPIWNPLTGFGGASARMKWRKLRQIVGSNLRVRAICEQRGIDVVHANGVPAMFCAWAGTKLAGARVTFHIRDLSKRRTLRWYEALSVLCADRTLVISPSLREALLAGAPPILAGALARRMHTLYNAIEFGPIDDHLARETREQARRELGLSPEDRCAVLVGSIEARKGQLRVIERVLPEVLASVPSLKLLLAGGGKDSRYERACRAAVARLGLEHCVRWLGYLPAAELLRVYRAADVALVASESEGLSRAAVEAHGFGLPIITTAIPGPVDVVRDGETGYHVPDDHIEQMAARLIQLAREPALAERMGRAGAAAVRARFSPEIHRREIGAIYEGLSRR